MLHGRTTSSRVRVVMRVGQLVRLVEYGGYQEYECMLCGVTLDGRKRARDLFHRWDCPVGWSFKRPRTVLHWLTKDL